MKWFIGRLKEPSTWAGFAGLIPVVLGVAANGGHMTPDQIGVLAAGIAAVLVKEKAQS